MSVKTDSRGRHTVEFRLRGIRVHRRCPKGCTKAEAEALETKIRRDIFTSRDLGVKPDVSLPAAIQMWLEERVAGSKSEVSRRHHALALAPYVIGKTVREIPDVAEAYRKAATVALATVNRRLMVLKAVAKYAWRKEWISENLSAKVWTAKEENAREVYLTAAQARELVSKGETPEGRAWIALAFATGLRRAELHGVGKVGGGRVKDGVILLGSRTKNGRPRAVPIAKIGLPYVKFFPFTRSVDSLDWEWRKARKAAGYKARELCFHDIRHSFASMLINRDVDLYTVGTLLGHKSGQTTQRYAHLYLAKLKKAVGKI